ncbi:hypothetical protein KP509_22G000500 [Ceratopteris richardii]|uniref:Uncharacterized protein n=1 Tax=Ceratopteris richardii TaxID=49495 RepID=A0A8T2S402_CERRI|nr:hypothetical protein KP509_22G000500 [Ceratopteris richardii]
MDRRLSHAITSFLKRGDYVCQRVARAGEWERIIRVESDYRRGPRSASNDYDKQEESASFFYPWIGDFHMQ